MDMWRRHHSYPGRREGPPGNEEEHQGVQGAEAGAGGNQGYNQGPGENAEEYGRKDHTDKLLQVTCRYKVGTS